MAVSITSRYRRLVAYRAAARDGTVRPTLPIRRTPTQTTAVYRHRVSGVEDVEYLAWRYLHNSASWWEVADANPIEFALDLRAGDVVEVPLGDRPDRADRTRFLQ